LGRTGSNAAEGKGESRARARARAPIANIGCLVISRGHFYGRIIRRVIGTLGAQYSISGMEHRRRGLQVISSDFNFSFNPLKPIPPLLHYSISRIVRQRRNYPILLTATKAPLRILPRATNSIHVLSAKSASELNNRSRSREAGAEQFSALPRLSTRGSTREDGGRIRLCAKVPSTAIDL